MTTHASRVVTGLVLALLAVGAVMALAASVDRQSSDAAHDLAAGLSCPSCEGQSVAESDSPVAVSMRRTITEQLSQGRTPDQVRDWFVGRYGSEVLRSGSGPAHLLWLVPVFAVTAAAAIAVMTVGRHRTATDDALPRSITAHRRAVFLSVSGLAMLMVAGIAFGGWWIGRSPPQAAEPAVASASDPLSNHLVDAQKAEARGDFVAAADQYGMAGRLSDDPAIRLRQAFSLLRAGQPHAATDVANAIRKANPDIPDALLILGLAQRASGDPAADETLTRFLALAPGHPASGEVQRLLGTGE